MDKDKLKEISITLPKEHKMVRTSFNISGLAVEAIKRLTENYGLTVNKIFELFLEDEFLVEYAVKDEDKILNRFAEKQDKITKAYAVSEKIRNNLNKIAKKYEIKRDRLVERSIIIFKELLSMRTRDKIKKLNAAQELVQKLNIEAGRVYDEISKTIKHDNEPKIMEAIIGISITCDEAIGEIEDTLNEYKEMLNEGGKK